MDTGEFPSVRQRGRSPTLRGEFPSWRQRGPRSSLWQGGVVSHFVAVGGYHIYSNGIESPTSWQEARAPFLMNRGGVAHLLAIEGVPLVAQAEIPHLLVRDDAPPPCRTGVFPSM